MFLTDEIAAPFHEGRLWSHGQKPCPRCGGGPDEHSWDIGPDLFLWPICPACDACGHTFEEHIGRRCPLQDVYDDD